MRRFDLLAFSMGVIVGVSLTVVGIGSMGPPPGRPAVSAPDLPPGYPIGYQGGVGSGYNFLPQGGH